MRRGMMWRAALWTAFAAASCALASPAVAKVAPRRPAPAPSWEIDRPDMGLRLVQDRQSGAIRHLRITGEVRPGNASLDYTSMRADAEADCAGRRERISAMTVFDGPGLTGPRREVQVHGFWTVPLSDAFMADVIDAVCGPTPLGDGLERVQTQAPQADPAPPPRVIRAAAARPQTQPTRSGATVPQLRPAIRAPIPAPARSTAAASGGVAVQLTASSSSAAAWSLLKSTSAPAGVTPAVIPVTTAGHTLYRALLQGFASKAQARAFCAARERAGAGCLVR